ncbi:iron-sulfur cluster biosynthesis family protein [Carnobacterium sp.]|uniref:iron-sulfur cluster biosynthesis family protein n=1 Tax=Carnobacterium sp. TaxID=48221 RepID=UPI003891041C
MFLDITELAQQKIKQICSHHTGHLVFYYESRIGCTCGNNGIFLLKITQQNDSELDATLDSSLGKLPIQGWSLPFLDDQMKLDYNESKHALILRSDSGLINDNVLILNDANQSIS